jgi:ribosomal protein S11
MQKHEKKQKSKLKFFKFSKRALQKYKKRLNFFRKQLRVKHIMRLTPVAFNENDVGLLGIRVTSNNIFCSLTDSINKNILLLSSAGKYKISVSRKKLRHVIKPFFVAFNRDLKTRVVAGAVVVNISAPIKIRRLIFKQLVSILSNKQFIIRVCHNKCYNGCRPAKKRRRKQRRLRISKYS